MVASLKIIEKLNHKIFNLCRQKSAQKIFLDF